MSGKNNDAGCGTIIAVLLIIGFISSYWPIIVGIIVAVVAIYIIYKVSKNKNKSSEKRSDNEYDYKPNGGIVLESGKYVASRDIEPGIYDILVLKGFGFLNTNAPEKVHVYLNEDNRKYKNIEISCDTVLNIDSGLQIELYNKRMYVETKRIETENQILNATKDTEIHMEPNKIDSDIDKMDGWKFEYFCADVLKEIGYINVNVTPGSGDQGVDIIAERDGIKYAIQCKRFSQPVGNKAVQEIYAGKKFYHCHVGIIMTNNYFTASAKELASENGIILWDRDFLKKYVDLGKSSINVESDGKYAYNREPNLSDTYVEKNSKKETIKMYDREKGIFPPGIYVVGEDLEKGNYLLNEIEPEENTWVMIYEDYSKYKANKCTHWETFSKDYYLPLKENGMVISVRNAEIRKL